MKRLEQNIPEEWNRTSKALIIITLTLQVSFTGVLELIFEAKFDDQCCVDKTLKQSLRNFMVHLNNNLIDNFFKI